MQCNDLDTKTVNEENDKTLLDAWVLITLTPLGCATKLFEVIVFLAR